MPLANNIGEFEVPAGVPALPIAEALADRFKEGGVTRVSVASLPRDTQVAFVRVWHGEEEAGSQEYAVHTGDVVSLRALAEVQLSMMLKRGPITVVSASGVPDDVAVLFDGGPVSQLLASIAKVLSLDMPLTQTVAMAAVLQPLFEGAFGVRFGEDVESTCIAGDDCVMRLRPASLGPTEEIADVRDMARPRLALLALGLIANAAVLREHPDAKQGHLNGMFWTDATTLAGAKGFPALSDVAGTWTLRLPVMVMTRWHLGAEKTLLREVRTYRMAKAMREKGLGSVVDGLIAKVMRRRQEAGR